MSGLFCISLSTYYLAILFFPSMSVLSRETWKFFLFTLACYTFFVIFIQMYIFKEEGMEGKKKFRPNPDLKLMDQKGVSLEWHFLKHNYRPFREQASRLRHNSYRRHLGGFGAHWTQSEAWETKAMTEENGNRAIRKRTAGGSPAPHRSQKLRNPCKQPFKEVLFGSAWDS